MTSLYIGFPYFIFFLFFLFLFFLEMNGVSFRTVNVSFYKDNRFLVLYLLSCIFILFIGLRGYVNTDWYQYIKVYNSIPNEIFPLINFTSTFEPGFDLLMRVAKRISGSYEGFVCLSSIVDLILFYCAFKDQKSILLCFIFFYIFCGSGAGFRLEFNLMRNVKSILLFCISLKYVYKKEVLKYIIINLIGMLFHVTSILYIPLYFLIGKRCNRKVLISLFVIGNIFFILQIKWLTPILVDLAKFLPGKLGVLLNTYLKIEAFNSSFGISIGYIERFITFLIFFKYYLICDDRELAYFNTWFVYSFIYLFCSEMFILLSRVALLFIVGYWYIYPNLYFKLSKSKKIIFILVISLYAFCKLCLANNENFVIYDNLLFSHMSIEERSLLVR